MSIITEALKKLQAERSNQNAPRSGTDQIKAAIASSSEQPAWKKPLFLKTVPAVILVCLISVGVVFAFMTKRTSKKVIPGKEKTAKPGLKPEEKRGTAPAASAQEKSTYSIEHLSQTEAAKPVVVEESQKVTQKYPVLNGIMYSPTHPQAIINGQVVTEGETVHGFTVDKILTSIVRGRLGAEELELKLK